MSDFFLRTADPPSQWIPRKDLEKSSKVGVQCPRCGKKMELQRIEVAGNTRHMWAKVMLVCSCRW